MENHSIDSLIFPESLSPEIDALSYQHRKSRHQGGIDRLEIELIQPINCETIIKQLHGNDVSSKVKLWNDGSRYCLSFSDKAIRLGLCNRFSKTSKKLICNPTHYTNLFHLEEDIKNTLGIRLTSADKIRRLDLAVNIPKPFLEVRYGLDIKSKRWVQSFISGEPTGFNVGKGEERYVIYDYGLRHDKKPSSITRVEVQLSGRKLPIDDFSEIKSLLSIIKDGTLNPFNKIILNDVLFRALSSEDKASNWVKRTEIKKAVELVGYTTARRNLNRNGNFNRTYAPFIQITPSAFSFQAEIINYLEEFFEVRVNEKEEQIVKGMA